MGLNLRAMFKDKRLLIPVGAAGLLGLVVLVKRGGLGAGGSSSSGGSDAATTSAGLGTAGSSYGGTGVYDSTGNDVASWLGNYSESLQNQLDQYGAQLNTATTELHEGLTGTAGNLQEQLTKLQTTVNGVAAKQQPAPVSTAGFQRITLDSSGVLGVGKRYGLYTRDIMALPQNQGLRGLTPAQAVGKAVYIPSGYRPKK